MTQPLEQLKAKLREVNDIDGASALLYWDQNVYMPKEGASARARQLATLSRLAHEIQTSAEMGRLLDAAEAQVAADRDASDRDRGLIRVARRNFEQQRRLPADFVTESKEHTSTIFTAWTKARPAADFAMVQPLLEKSLELSLRRAAYFSEFDHPADSFIDANDEGMTAASVRALFAELRQALVPLVQKVAEKARPDDAFISRHYPKAEQLAFGEKVVRALGYDFERGRADLTHHPFMIKFSLGDVRITTRVNESDFGDAFFSTVHEAGHALYEQGIDRALEGTPLAAGVSAGVHESQSRLWENMVARSRGFWAHFLPEAQKQFPEQLGDVDLDTFYRGINAVGPSLIRVDADELTYNLHVMIRFDLELQMLEGKLKVKDLPEAWNARYKSDLGVVAPTAQNGVLQDVHWFCELIGGLFQGYTLGNVMSAQFFAAANRAEPGIEQEIARGDTSRLHRWLTEHIYRHGSTYAPAELVTLATGKALAIDDYVAYLTSKFGDLYGL